MLEHIVIHFPNAPEWITTLFQQTSTVQVDLIYNVVLWVVIFIAMFLLTSYQRRYSELLLQLFSIWWVLYQPFQQNMLTFNLNENAMFANGFFNFITNWHNFFFFLQLAAGIILILSTIRFVIRAFVIAPMKYKSRQRQGSAYRKKQQRKKKKKAQRNQESPVKEQKQRTPSEKPNPKRLKPKKEDDDINAYM